MNEQAKGNTMYERLSVVAELNRVNGFDPLKFARKVIQNGAERLQLDLKYKKLWFRLKYPQGRIKVTPLKITEQLAIIEAKVFFDRKDTAPSASFIAQRYAKDTPGGLYIESAQYMATDTALNDAGFGLQFVDAGAATQSVAQAKTEAVEVPVAAAVPPIAESPAPALQEQRVVQDEATDQRLQTEPAATAQTAAEQPLVQAEQPPAEKLQEQGSEPPAAVTPIDTVPVTEEPSQEPPAPEKMDVQPEAAEPANDRTEEHAAEPVQSEEQPQTGTESFSIEVDSTAEDVSETGPAGYSADMTVDQICSMMTLDEARNIIVDVGTCKGQTLAWVSERRAASLKWYLNGYQGDNNVLKAGAKLLLESLTMEKAS